MKMLSLLLFLSILYSSSTISQWTHIGLAGRGIKDIAAGDSAIFAVTADSGCVYRSTDEGQVWERIVPSHAIDMAVAPTGTVFMLVSHMISVADHQDTLFYSTDNGGSWNRASVPGVSRLLNVTVSGSGNIVCGIENRGRTEAWTGTTLSTDNGLTWSEVWPCGGLAYAFREQSILSYGSY